MNIKSLTVQILPTLSPEGIDKVAERIESAILADRGQGRVKSTKSNIGTVRVSAPTKSGKSGMATWTESESTRKESNITPALRIEAALHAFNEGVKRGLFCGQDDIPLHNELVEWIQTVAQRVTNPPAQQ